MRVRALSGVAGPVAFTAAWVAASLRQTGHGAVSVQLSGLAAPDARDPWIMISGFLVLGGCTVWFGEELARDVGGPAPRLIQGAGVLTMAAGLLRRDHMQLTSGPVSWHNEAHTVVSLVLYLDLVLAQLLLARRFAAIPCWRPWRVYLLGSGIATAVALAVFLPNTTSPSAGILQRIAVTIPLAAVTAVAARLSRPDTASKVVDGPSTAIEGGRWPSDSVSQHARRSAHWSWMRR
ncbi:MAG: DUF998 domain-containing protein [Trebonia sp.]|uniref:DUF998 domain-containing protein n=1 Tax=Trebonia sp. TaxID=2767075 RepID=UPI003BAF9608